MAHATLYGALTELHEGFEVMRQVPDHGKVRAAFDPDPSALGATLPRGLKLSVYAREESMVHRVCYLIMAIIILVPPRHHTTNRESALFLL